MAYTAKYIPSTELSEEDSLIIRQNYESALLHFGIICNILKKKCGKSDPFHRKVETHLRKMVENHIEFFEVSSDA